VSIFFWHVGIHKKGHTHTHTHKTTVFKVLDSIILSYTFNNSRPGSSVVIGTDYGLDGPGSNPGEDETFRPSRPALGPTPRPVQCVPGLFRG